MWTAFQRRPAHKLWKKNIGLSPTAFGNGVAGYPPIGILGTPVIDAKPGADRSADNLCDRRELGNADA